MGTLPYMVHGLTAGQTPDLLVHIEHTHLLELYERALVTVEQQIAASSEPKYTTSPGYLAYGWLKRDREHYKKMIDWLKGLKR